VLESEHSIRACPRGGGLLLTWLARPEKERPRDEGVQASGAGSESILGTLHYMAPEQVEGREADTRSDLWAFGAVLYEMVAGQQAFSGES